MTAVPGLQLSTLADQISLGAVRFVRGQQSMTLFTAEVRHIDDGSRIVREEGQRPSVRQSA